MEKKATYTPDEYNSQQTGNYKGLTLEQLMIFRAGSESIESQSPITKRANAVTKF